MCIELSEHECGEVVQLVMSTSHGKEAPRSEKSCRLWNLIFKCARKKLDRLKPDGVAVR